MKGRGQRMGKKVVKRVEKKGLMMEVGKGVSIAAELCCPPNELNIFA